MNCAGEVAHETVRHLVRNGKHLMYGVHLKEYGRLQQAGCERIRGRQTKSREPVRDARFYPLSIRQIGIDPTLMKLLGLMIA